MTTFHLARCPNCHALPEFRPSGDRHYKVLLAHDSRTCPPRFGLHAYHHTPSLAAAKWNEHVAALRPPAHGRSRGGVPVETV